MESGVLKSGAILYTKQAQVNFTGTELSNTPCGVFGYPIDFDKFNYMGSHFMSLFLGLASSQRKIPCRF